MEQFLFVKAEYGTLVTVKTLALVFLLLIYSIKLYFLLSFRLGKDISRVKGDINGGVVSSLTVNLRPWAMESSSKNFLGWLEFLMLHVGILAAIISSFLIPYAPDLLTAPIAYTFSILAGLGFLAGLSRMVKKMSRPQLKIISSKDDYFCIVMINIFLLAGTLALTGNKETIVAFLVITAFLLVYVPFSKISHYLYWPFSRYYMGKHFGRRGIYM
jgi:nitrate reductase gamma subunit